MFSPFRSRGSCYCLINNDFQLACQWGTCGAGDILLPFDWKISRLPDGQLVFLSQRANIPSVHHTPLRCEASENRWWYTNKKKVLSDRDYRGDVAADIEKDFGIELEVSNTPNGVKGFLPKPLRWVVERTFAWLDSCRRLSRNYEILNESAEEMIDFAAIKILINKI